MPVIINEFEVVADAPEPATQARSPQQEEQQRAAAQPLRPVDMITILEHNERRLARLAAD
jgi:hypothetical protein